MWLRRPGFLCPRVTEKAPSMPGTTVGFRSWNGKKKILTERDLSRNDIYLSIGLSIDLSIYLSFFLSIYIYMVPIINCPESYLKRKNDDDDDDCVLLIYLLGFPRMFRPKSHGGQLFIDPRFKFSATQRKCPLFLPVNSTCVPVLGQVWLWLCHVVSMFLLVTYACVLYIYYT